MNARVVLVPAIVVVAAAGIWLTQRPGATGEPAATWRVGAGPEFRQGRNYDDLPAETPIRLAFHCGEPRFVYVFSHSVEDGTLLLFPSPAVKSDATQPVAPGHVALPGSRDGKDLAWTSRRQVSITTTFLVVAARERVPALEALLPRLRRWTNTALTDGAMEVTNPPDGTEVAAGPRTPLPDPLLQRAADASFTATVVNGPLLPDPQLPGVWIGSWRVKETPSPGPNPTPFPAPTPPPEKR